MINNRLHIKQKAAEQIYLDKVRDSSMQTPAMLDAYDNIVVKVEISIPEVMKTKLLKTSKQNPLARNLLWLTALQVSAFLYKFGDSILITSPALNKKFASNMRGSQDNTFPDPLPGEIQVFASSISWEHNFKQILESNKTQLIANSNLPYPDGEHFYNKVNHLYEELSEYLGMIYLRDNSIHITEHLPRNVGLDVQINENELILESPNGRVHQDILNQFGKTMLKVQTGLLSDLDTYIKDLSWQVDYDFSSALSQNEVCIDPSLSVFSIFVDTVKSFPSRIAIDNYGRQITYKELLQEVEDLSSLFVNEKGIIPGDIIAVVLDRDESLAVTLMACIRTGAVYLPIDPVLPNERIDFIFNNSNTKLLVTNEKGIKRFASISIPVVNPSVIISSESCVTEIYKPSPGDPSYAIFTSGTTGAPKGMLQTHSCLSNLVQWTINELNITEPTRILQSASIGFDVSLHEILLCLLSGSTLYFISAEDKIDVHNAIEFIRRQEIEIFWLPISVLNLLFADKSPLFKKHSIKHIIGTGETLKVGPGLYRFLRENTTVKLYNFYGPSETHVITAHTVNARLNNIEALPPIGTPIANTTIQIKNEKGHILPQGIWGELYAGGANIALGYINRPDENKNRFLEDPSNPGGRIYKTGDIVHWNAEGVLVYKGRSDDQIKIRGYRIELGEIEKVILDHKNVSNVFIIPQEERNGTLIHAYVQSQEDISADVLRKHLLESLPPYMVPSRFYILAQFPLSANGKIDRRKLMILASELSDESEYYPPRNDQEKQLVEIWQQVLKTDETPGIKDNFFSLGGHSLNAMQVISMIRDELGLQVPLWKFFENPTPAELSQSLVKIRVIKDNKFARTPKAADYPLTAQQLSLYFASKVNKNNLAYALPYLAQLSGPIDYKRMESAFAQLLKRYPILAVAFVRKENEIRQVLSDVPTFSLDIQNIRNNETEKVIADFFRPLNLSQPPLIQVKLLMVSHHEHYLLLNLHHIIADGITMTLLINEFSMLYKGHVLSSPKRNYFDYAAYQQRWKTSEDYKTQAAFWKSYLNNCSGELHLPFDFSENRGEGSGNTIHFSIDTQNSKEIRRMAREKNRTPFSIFLSAYALLLYKLTLQEEIIIGFPSAGRRLPEVEKMPGLFLNTLVLRSFINPQDAIEELLGNIQVQILKILDNQEYPFVDLMQDLKIPTRNGNASFINCWFDFHNLPKINLNIPGIAIDEMPFETGASKFDLAILIEDNPLQYDYRIEYNKNLFKVSSIKRINRLFQNILGEILKDPFKKVQDIKLENIESEKENNQVQTSYNF